MNILITAIPYANARIDASTNQARIGTVPTNSILGVTLIEKGLFIGGSDTWYKTEKGYIHSSTCREIGNIEAYLSTFISKWIGKYTDYDGKYGNQCVDLARRCLEEVWKVPQSIIPYSGYAIQQYWGARDTEYSRVVKNSLLAIPKPGSIIYWNANVPGITFREGHVAVVESATLWNVTVIEQNMPTGAPIRRNVYRYRGIVGWIEPRNI